MTENKVKIKLESYDHRLLDNDVRRIVEVARASGADVQGPIPLPVKRKLFFVGKSPHKDKKTAGEQFQRIIHKRLLVLKCQPKTINSLKKLSLSTAINIKITTI